MTDKTPCKLQQLSIIALCCTISYSIPKNNIFSWIVIMLSAVCVLLIAVKKEEHKIWCSIIIAVSIMQIVPHFPTFSVIIREIPIIAAMLILLFKQTKTGAFTVIGITATALICALIFFIMYDAYTVKLYLSTGIGSTELIYFSRKLIFEWAAEIFAYYVYPVMVSLLILKGKMILPYKKT